MRVRMSDAERNWLDDHFWAIRVERSGDPLFRYFWRAAYIPPSFSDGPPPPFKPIPFGVADCACTRGGAYRAALRWLRGEARRHIAREEAAA